MKAIEWAWGLRKGTLNLDTRQNIFFREFSRLASVEWPSDHHPTVGAAVHALYKSRKWALLPSEEIIDQYLTEPCGKYLGIPLDREDFPNITVS